MDASQHDIKQDEQLQSLRQDVDALRITLIGLDGQNGMRSQISSIFENFKTIEHTLKELSDCMHSFRKDEEKNSLIFATKQELYDVESKVMGKLEEMSSKQEEDRKKREERRKDEEAQMTRLKYARYSLYLAIIGLVFKETLKLFS